MIFDDKGDQHPQTAETNYLQPSDLDNGIVIEHEEAGQPANALEAALTATMLGLLLLVH